MGKKKNKKKKAASERKRSIGMTEERFSRLLQKYSESPPRLKF